MDEQAYGGGGWAGGGGGGRVTHSQFITWMSKHIYVCH